jgi:YVTN family beta-propeller protein
MDARRERRELEALGIIAAVAAAVLIGLRPGGGDADMAASASEPASSPVAAELSVRSSPASTSEPGRPLSSADARPSADVYAAIASGTLAHRVADTPTRVYVPNNTSDTVSIVDPRTYRVIRTVRVGLGPQHITPSWDLRHLYVGNTYSSTLTEIDPRSGRVVRTIPVPDPYNLYFTPDGSVAVDVAERLRTLYLFDPETWKRIGAIRIPFAGIDHLDFSADGRFLLISAEYSGMVAKVSLATRRVVGSLRVGGSPVDVKLSPDGSVFYVANQERGGVSVVDPVAMKEVGFIRTGAGAHGFCMARDAEHLYVSNRLAGTISVLDPASDRVVHTWDVGGSPDMLQISADGRLLWVSNRYDGSISVVSTASGRVVRTIRVGSSPHGLTLFPQPGRYSLGHNGVYR